ncbi:ATP-binding protein [Ancylobacter terrae]|uniref:ATP-binding protein n=1 Tax=Ancylobacter sp. sgz301288 TaxID=3342077 RepID=UPI00385BCA24
MARSYAFGPFVLVPEQQLLMDGQRPVRIGSRSLELLAALVERPGELVSKAELVSRAWPDTFVEDSNLKVNIAALRRTLGDVPGGARYIATVNGRGYRFVSPVRAFGRGSAPERADEPPARSHNLPVPPTRLIGRAAAVEAVLHQFDLSRLVSLVGPGGIGKTRVALAAADRLLARCEHGVWFIDLARVDSPAFVPGAIAAAIDLNVHSADIPLALQAFLRDRELMLVLDNCEHLADAVASCVELLLAGAARLRVLATSREPLRLAGERVYRLPPLEAPPLSRDLAAADALAFPAVELFVERAAGNLGDFALGDADAAAVAAICRRLDGLPLAIELAATRVDAFGAGELLDRLDDRFQLLKGRPGHGRHETLAATLDWSYHLLSAGERSVLRRLSVFAGAFDLRSACALAGDGRRESGDLVADVANLVAKSLLATERGEGGTLLRLLDTTRRYALHKLDESGEREELRRRHAEHLLQIAEHAEAEWDRLPTAKWLARYGPRVDDIRSALGWAFAGGRGRPIAVSLTVAAIPFWEHLSLVEECRAAVKRALDRGFDDCRSERDDMKLCMALGTTLLHTRGPLPEVKSAWARALHLAERLDDAEYVLRCLWGLCDFHTWTGDHRAALAIAQRIRQVAMDRGDLAASINVDRQAGTALRYLGEPAEARRHLERMIGRYIPPVVRSDIARFQLDPRLAAWGTLANVLWLQGYPDQAVAMARRQLDGAERADHALALCNAMVHAACPVALLVGDMATAEHLLARIDTHVAEHAMTVWSAMGRCLRGEWLLARGEAAGLTVLQQALGELADVGFRMRYPVHLGAYAAGLGAHGEVDAARRAIDQALALSASSGEVWGLPELLRIRGDLLRLEGSAPAAQAAGDCYRQALDAARRQGALSWELRAATSLAEYCHGTGEGGPARDLLAATYDRFAEGFGTRDLRRARSLLDALGLHRP